MLKTRIGIFYLIYTDKIDNTVVAVTFDIVVAVIFEIDEKSSINTPETKENQL